MKAEPAKADRRSALGSRQGNSAPPGLQPRCRGATAEVYPQRCGGVGWGGVGERRWRELPSPNRCEEPEQPLSAQTQKQQQVR